MTAKLDKVEVYSEGPPSIESFDALITLSRDRWKILYLNFRGTYAYQT